MRIGILANIHKPESQSLAQELVEWLLKRGHRPLLYPDLVPLIGHKQLALAEDQFR